MELFSRDVNGEPEISGCCCVVCVCVWFLLGFFLFVHGRLLCVIREGCYILRLCQHANCNH